MKFCHEYLKLCQAKLKNFLLLYRTGHACYVKRPPLETHHTVKLVLSMARKRQTCTQRVMFKEKVENLPLQVLLQSWLLCNSDHPLEKGWRWTDSQWEEYLKGMHRERDPRSWSRTNFCKARQTITVQHSLSTTRSRHAAMNEFTLCMIPHKRDTLILLKLSLEGSTRKSLPFPDKSLQS